MLSVHVRKNARRRLCQRVRRSLFIIARIDPPHNPEAADIIEINRLKVEETEVTEVDPIAAVLVAREVRRTRQSDIRIRHRDSIANQGGPCGSKWIAISVGLCDKKTA